MKKMTDLQLGWLSGILDGEGCIGLYRSLRASGRLIYFPTVSVVNTNKTLIDTISYLTGFGTVYEYGSRTTGDKKIWRWQSSSVPDILDFLLEMQPLVIAKKPQINTLIKFCVVKSLGLDSDFEPYYLQLQELNRRGSKKQK